MILTSSPIVPPDARIRHGIPTFVPRITALALAMVCSCLFTLEGAAQTNWVDDTVPAGAWTGADGGDSWTWVSANPAPISGARAHQSSLAAGIHYHYFANASARLAVNPGDTLYAYVYLDPANPPREIMLQWYDGTSWSHAGYWGANLIAWGTDGTPSQQRIGTLPPPGQWARLNIPASLVGLEGRTVSGMNFILSDGRATWDDSGKTAQPTVSVITFDSGANEYTQKTGTFYISRTGNTNGPVTVHFTFGGTATPGLDYQTPPTSATIPAGESWMFVTITPTDDEEPEPNETVVLVLADNPAYVVGPQNTATLSIADNDLEIINVTASDPDADESGGNPGVFTLTRQYGASYDLTVWYTLSGTASNGVDYAALPEQVTFPASATTIDVVVRPIADSLAEGSETVRLTITPDARYRVGPSNSATVAISDNTSPSLSTVTASVIYGHAAETSRDRGVFGIERSGGDLNSPLTVYFSFGGTATPGSDYETDPAQGSITFPPQVIGVQVYVTPFDDVEIEGQESIVLTLATNSNYRIGTSNSATIFIEDNDIDSLPTVTVTAWPPFAEEHQYPPPYLPVEGGYTLQRSGGTSAPLTVNFSLGGTAINGVDYERLPESVTFPSGIYFTSLNVKAIDDSEPEGPETVILTLTTNAAYLVGSPASGTVTIVDDDKPPPVVTVQATDPDASEAGPDTGMFTLTRSDSIDQPLTVYFSLGGTAVPGTDYLLNNQNPGNAPSVTFQPGDAQTNLVVTPLADNISEGAEVVILTISRDPRVVTYYTPGSPNSANITIADNGAGGQDLFVSLGNGNILKVTPDGTQSFFAGGMKRPLGLAFDRAGNLFAADRFEAAIYKFTTGGARSAFATNFYSPFGLALDDAGDLYATTGNGASVYSFSADGTRNRFAGAMQFVTALAFDSAGSLFVTDIGGTPAPTNAARIYKFNPAGARIIFASGLNESYGLAFNGAGELFYSDHVTGDIHRFTAAGQRSTFASGLSYPSGLAFDSGGMLYVSEQVSGNIYKFMPDGARSTFVSGLNGPSFIAFGPVTAAADTTPPAVAIIAPTNNMTVYGTVAVSAGASDNVGVAGVQFKLDGANLGAEVTSAPYSANWNTAGAANGSHILTAVARDAAGNQTDSAPVTVTVLNTIPAGPLSRVQVAASDAGASERFSTDYPRNSGEFVFWRNGDTAAALTVYYTLGGTAANGADYETLPGSVTFPAGASYATVSVMPVNDSTAEDYESIVLTLNPNAAYTVGLYSNAVAGIAASFTLPDGSFTVRVMAAEETASENGLNPGEFIVTRSQSFRPPLAPLTVNYKLSGTAGNGVDYETLPGTVTIPAGANFTTLTVKPFDDHDFTGTKSVTLTLLPGQYYSTPPADSTATVFIMDDDPPSVTETIWVNDALPAGAWTGTSGGDSWAWISNSPPPFYGALAHQSSLGPGIHNHYFAGATATLAVNSGDRLVTYVYLDPFNPPREIMLEWSDGSSWSHAAYWGENLIPRGNNGTASQQPMGPLPAAGQWARLEVPASFLDLEGRTLSGMNFILYDGRAAWGYSGKATAATRPPPPPLTVAAGSASASERGLIPGSFTISRARTAYVPLTVYYTISGTASNGVDYQTLSGAVTIPPGASSTNIVVQPVSDTAREGPETVTLTLATNAGYSLARPYTATVTIADNSPTVTVSASDPYAWETGPEPGAFTISYTGDTNTPLTVYYALGGTASNGVDYQTLPGSVTFPAGISSLNIPVQPIDDSEAEGPQTVVLGILSPTNGAYQVAYVGSATVTIADNDEPPPTVTTQVSYTNATESGYFRGIIRVDRSGDLSAPLTVYYTLGGTASNGVDYRLLPGSVTIPIDWSYALIFVDSIEDAEVEGTETVVLTLSSNAAYTVGSPASANVTISDNDYPPMYRSTAIPPPDSSPGPVFGTALAMDGDTLVVGPHIFLREGTNWAYRAKLQPADGASPFDNYGSAVAVNGDTAVIGAPYADFYAGGNSGAAYVFVKNGDTWAQQATLVASDLAAGNLFGQAVAIDHDTAAVGGLGGVYVFARTGTNWTQQAKLTGNYCAVSGDTILTGAPEEASPAGPDSGAAYVFVRNGANWVQQAALRASPDVPSARFGRAVALRGDTALIGSPFAGAGAFQVFSRSGSNWTLQASAIPPDGTPDEWFGRSVALSTDATLAVIGAPGNDDRGFNAGTVYIYARQGTNWEIQTKLTPDNDSSVEFGSSVAASASRIGVGKSRGAYVFDPLTGTGIQAASVVWVDGAVPAGAWTGADGGDRWNWITNNPMPFLGARAHQSIPASGIHNHYFAGASTPLTVNPGDTLFTYVYLDPANPPREVMLQWFDGNSWSHAAYWGANLIAWGANNTDSQRPMGALPPPGSWARLGVPASLVGLEGKTISGMNFILYDGRAAFDYTGKTAQPTISVITFDNGANEYTQKTGTFYISRTGNTNGPVTVHFTFGGTATPGLDYQTPPDSATIPAGESWVFVTITPIDDTEPEPMESVILTLSDNPAYIVGSPNSASLSIADNDPEIINVTASDPQADESGSNPGVFRFTRQYGAPYEQTVFYTLSGTASNGVDYANLSGSVTFPASATTVDVVVEPVADSLAEGSETVVLTITPYALYTVGPSNSATVTIVDSTTPVPTVRLIVDDTSAHEPGRDRRTDTGSYFITRNGDTSAPLTVYYTVGGTATPDVDYVALPGSATIPAGTATIFGTIQPLPDAEVEVTETVVLSLNPDPHYQVGSPAGGSIAIIDDDAATAPVVSVVAFGAATVSEGGDFTSFRFDRQGGTSAPLTVRFTLGGTAINGTDYEQLSNSVTFGFDAYTVVLPVRPIDDSSVEGSETVVLTLSTNAAYSIGQFNTATVTIQDNDPTVTVVASASNASENGPNPGTFTISRNSGITAPLTVFFTLGGTASNGTDYQPSSNSATIPAGATSTTITVTPINDTEVEGPETVVLTLQANGDYYLGSPNSATVTIADSAADNTPPAVAITSPGSNVTASGTILILVNASDNFSVTGLQLKLDGANVIEEATNTPYWFYWDTTVTSDGPHTLTAVARDAAGNQATSSPVTVTVDNGTHNPVLFVSLLGGSVAKVATNGTQTLFATGLGRPQGLAFDQAGNLFVADDVAATIYKFTPGGMKTSFASNSFAPLGLAFDSAGNLYATDGSASIYRYAPDGTQSLYATGMAFPIALAFDSAGHLFVTDAGNTSNDGHIYKFASDGTRTTFATGLGGSHGLAFDGAGNLFCADGSVIYRFTPGGQRSTFATGLNSTMGLAVDSNGTLLAADMGGRAIYQFPAAGASGVFAGGLDWPTFMAFAPTAGRPNRDGFPWVDDAIPTGAWTGAGGGDNWNWVTGSPTPYSGSRAHQSVPVAGIHYHYFADTSAPLMIHPGDTLVAHVYVDPAHPPREIMLQWFDGTSWSHRAYWGEDLIKWGTSGTASQRPMGAVPPEGRWMPLEIPAWLVDLEGKTISGMNFILYDGSVTWDRVDVRSAGTPDDDEPIQVIQ